MNTFSKPKNIRYFLASFTIIFLLVFVILILNIVKHNHETEKEAIQKITSKGESVANALDKNFEKLKKIGRSMADAIMDGRIKKEDLDSVIKDTLSKNPTLYGLGVAFEPDYFGKGTHLYAPFYIQTKTGLEFRPVEKFYNYTFHIEAARWYQDTKKRQKEGWAEPQFGKASNALIELYTVPLFTPSTKEGKKFCGTVIVSYSLSYIQTVMDNFGLEKTGYGYIISQKERFLNHPRRDVVRQKKTLSHLAREINRDDLRQLAVKLNEIKVSKGEAFRAKSILTGEPAILYLKTLPSIGWHFIADFIKDGFVIDYYHQRKFTIWTIISGCLFLIFLCALLAGVHHGTTRSLWLWSIAISLILCVGIVAIWACERESSRDITNGGIKVSDRTTLRNFLNENGGKHFILIPTGVFIQSLEFRSGSDVFVTGTIWQKYSKKLPQNLSKGFVFAEAIDSDITKVYEVDSPEETVIGWNFEALLRQSFDYRWYPMDKKDVWVRLVHADFDKPAVLVPDLDAYELLYPSFRPGIESNIVIPGLSLKRSFFSYVLQNYNTNFGCQKYYEDNTLPELYFTVIVERKFLDPFISYLLPALVVAFIIFSLLLITTYQEKKIIKSAYNSSFILGAAAGLFFSVLIAHSQLRTAIKVDYLIYLDYFYIILYPLILLLMFNSFMVSSDRKNKFFQFRDDLLSKLLYWPIVTLFLFILTVVIVY